MAPPFPATCHFCPFAPRPIAPACIMAAPASASELAAVPAAGDVPLALPAEEGAAAAATDEEEDGLPPFLSLRPIPILPNPSSMSTIHSVSSQVSLVYPSSSSSSVHFLLFDRVFIFSWLPYRFDLPPLGHHRFHPFPSDSAFLLFSRPFSLR